MKFGENLKRIRKNKKISQEYLAERLGVSRQSISKWETGENYPSMTNIMCLCDIFKCKINELVHEDMVDINSLDKDVKMSVVKFKENEQKKMKIISKAIYVIARIFKVVSVVSLVGSIILFIGSLILIPNIKFNTNKEIIKVFDKEYKYELSDNEFIVNNKKITTTITAPEKVQISKFIEKDTIYQVAFSIILSVSLLVFSIFLYRTLLYIEKLFVNINECDTPFSLDNTNYIKAIAFNLTICLLSPDLLGTLSGLIFNIDLGVEIDIMNYLLVVIVIALSYIFKYGYEIQLDSKGRIYGD